MSTPCTPNELTLNDPRKPPPPPPPPPPKPPPPPAEKDGIFPDTVESVSVRPPATPATFGILAIDVTAEASSGARAKERRVLVWIVVPGAGRVRVPADPLNPNPNPPAEPAAGAWVTVTSVPTP